MTKYLKGEEVLNRIDEVTNEASSNEFHEVILDSLLGDSICELELLGDVLSNSEKLKRRESAEKVRTYYEKETKIRECLNNYNDDIF